jgi:hypothetical protein
VHGERVVRRRSAIGKELEPVAAHCRIDEICQDALAIFREHLND